MSASRVLVGLLDFLELQAKKAPSNFWIFPRVGRNVSVHLLKVCGVADPTKRYLTTAHCSLRDQDDFHIPPTVNSDHGIKAP